MNTRELAELCLLHGALQKPEEIDLLCQFLQGKCCRTVVEIGTARGGTLWLWHHLEGNETVISIDKRGSEWGGGPTAEDLERIHNFLDPRQNTYLADMDSHDPKTLEEVKETLAGREVDILFIDGDHSYEGVKKDFEMYSPLVRQGGIIIMHDIREHPPEMNCHVKEFWDEVKMKHPYWEFCVDQTGGKFLTMPYVSSQKSSQPWGGIGVIQW